MPTSRVGLGCADPLELKKLKNKRTVVNLATNVNQSLGYDDIFECLSRMSLKQSGHEAKIL